MVELQKCSFELERKNGKYVYPQMHTTNLKLYSQNLVQDFFILCISSISPRVSSKSKCNLDGYITNISLFGFSSVHQQNIGESKVFWHVWSKWSLKPFFMKVEIVTLQCTFSPLARWDNITIHPWNSLHAHPITIPSYQYYDYSDPSYDYYNLCTCKNVFSVQNI